MAVSPISLSIEAYPERYTRMREMGYDGNRLLRELEKLIGKIEIKQSRPSGFREEPPKVKLRQKISF